MVDLEASHPLSATLVERGYSLFPGTPPAEEYCRLRLATGLSAKDLKGAVLGLPNTLFGVTVQHSGEIVGMGRVVGDGGLFFFLVDIAVDPKHQKRGLGKAIVGALVSHLKETAPPSAHVTLIADGEAHRLYEQFGFRMTAPFAHGMFFVVD